MNLQNLIAITCFTLLPLSGKGLSAIAAETQPENKTFGDWCRKKASLSPEARHNVEVMLKEAGTTECDAANRKLSSLTELTLDNNKISDIKPLQSLTNLIALSLGKNKISDIKPLRSLTKLSSLALSNNKISDITPLKSLTNLTQLFLDNNQITDITPLPFLTKLSVLFANNNKISNTKPLQFLTKLTNIFLGDNPIAPKTCPVKPESICNWERVIEL